MLPAVMSSTPPATPGFAFVQFEDPRDAEDSVRELNGKNGWRVEVARAPRSRDAAPGGGKCVSVTGSHGRAWTATWELCEGFFL